MLKFLFASVILSQGFCKLLPSFDPTDTMIQQLLSSITVPKPNQTNETDEKVPVMPGSYNFYATHQTFLLGAPCVQNNATDLRSDNIRKEIRSDYTVTPGIGAHKFHYHKATWNKARRTCIREKGHLAVIRSAAEEKVIKQMMCAASVDQAWVGFHDKFEEGDWVTMFDEPIEDIPWAPWSTAFSSNPDNFQGKEHCGCFLGKAGGINDDNCDKEFPYFCKISID